MSQNPMLHHKLARPKGTLAHTTVQYRPVAFICRLTACILIIHMRARREDVCPLLKYKTAEFLGRRCGKM